MFTEDSGAWLTCQFCCSKFNSRDEWKSHTFGHFKAKQCSDCDADLIQICDDWFELHTITKCQTGSHISRSHVKHIELNDHLVEYLEVKQEPIVVTEFEQNEETGTELNETLGEIFAADFDEASNDDHSNTFNMDATEHSNSFGVDFFNNKKSQYTFEVTNIKQINKRSDDSQSYNKNCCKHCGRRFMSFKRLDNHIKRCASSRKKREYLRSHPHQPASDFICDLCGDGKTLKTFRGLIDHMNEIHLRNASYKCRICDKSYTTRYYLRKHFNRHKDASVGETINDDLDYGLMERKKYRRRLENQGPEDLTCDVCGRQFKHHYSLVEHKSSQHMAKSEFQCHKCERYYPNR